MVFPRAFIEGVLKMKKKLLSTALVLAIFPGTCDTLTFQQSAFLDDGFVLSAKFVPQFTGIDDDPPTGNDPPNNN